jgi:hypothetical protein
MPEFPIPPDVVEAALDAQLAAEEAGHDCCGPVAMEAAIREALDKLGLREERPADGSALIMRAPFDEAACEPRGECPMCGGETDHHPKCEVGILSARAVAAEQRVAELEEAADGHRQGAANLEDLLESAEAERDALKERVDLLEQWLGWIRATCQRNFDGESAATYRGLVNFIDFNLPDAAQRVAEEEGAALAASVSKKDT